MRNVLDWMIQRGVVSRLVVYLLFMIACVSPARAFDFEAGGKPGKVMGYLNQGVQFGVAGDHYDTMSGFQAAILQFLLEVNYRPSRKVSLFASTNVNVDWAYVILDGSNRWNAREFNESKENLHIFDDYETVLSELHGTWSPGSFVFRLGKQIVSWGETDLIRVMDQINPVDQRRGITDVEFESTIIPIWLLKAEYYPPNIPNWVQDLGLEFVFNFNADFIGDKALGTGNDVHGIWAANISAGLFYDVEIPGIGYLPTDIRELFPPPLQNLLDRLPVVPGRVGAMDLILDEPDSWDPDYFEYGLRVKTIILDTVITLNGFYGRANSPVLVATGDVEYREASDGTLIVEPTLTGYYPLFRFAGFTLSRDFENLNIRALGGIAPVLRLEALYAFDSTFSTDGKVGLMDQVAGATEEFEKHDEIRYAIGIDWNVKIRWLNARDAFMISPQFIHQHVLDFPSDYGLVGTGGPVEENNYDVTLMVQTTYFNNKLIPMVFWSRSFKGPETGDMLLAQLTYERSHHWNYTVGAAFFEGELMSALNHKDHVFVTVGYRF